MRDRGREEVEAFKGVLREHGMQITAARLSVLQVLQDTDGHHSVEEIHRAILARYPALNAVTVYRTLEQLEAHGLATRVTLGDKLTRWERATPAHHHLVCRSCGAVLEVAPAPFERLAAELERTYGVRVHLRHLALPGLCARCVASAA
jgi:Fe2+ or Zn2+ uptake regulation protein